jgi:hypothetical protein
MPEVQSVALSIAEGFKMQSAKFKVEYTNNFIRYSTLQIYEKT